MVSSYRSDCLYFSHGADCHSYIVDFEVCDEYRDKPDYEFEFSDREFIYWTLAQRNPRTKELEL